MNRKISSNTEKITYVFDLDGVVYRGQTPQDYAVESINALLDLNHNVYYFTNNASLTRMAYVEKLEKLGIHTTEDKVMTSSYATALYMQDNYEVKGKKVFVVGHEGIFDEIKRIGAIPYCNEELEECDFVVCGIDRNITYKKIWSAMHAIRKGSRFIATNADKTYPLEDDMLAPGGGAIVAAIEAASGVTPYICGKPNTYALEKIMEITGSMKENTVMIGDRLDTDMEIANNADIISALVLGGVTSFEDACKAEGNQKPDFIIKDLRELLP